MDQNETRFQAGCCWTGCLTSILVPLVFLLVGIYAVTELARWLGW